MVTGSQEFVAFVMEQLGPLGELSHTRFFGGIALKSRDVMFAMVMDGALYFAVDETLRLTYRRMGSRCFSYNTKKGRVEVTRFWEVPAELIEDGERLADWARQSIEAAARSSISTRKRRRSR